MSHMPGPIFRTDFSITPSLRPVAVNTSDYSCYVHTCYHPIYMYMYNYSRCAEYSIYYPSQHCLLIVSISDHSRLGLHSVVATLSRT